jgi:hypothetical protein
MTGTRRRLRGGIPAAATRSISRPLTHHRFRGRYSRPGKQARVFLERQAIMADPAVPEWVPDFPPVRSARIISARAQDAARVWEQPVTPGELLTIGKDLGSPLGNTGAALARLAYGALL